jgi:hypothetical protein
MTATNKRYTYPWLAAIRIDIHPVGENPINTPHTFHARFMYGPRPYISHGMRRKTFTTPHGDETCPYTWKKSWQQKTDCPTIILGHLIPHHDSIGVGERGSVQLVTQLHQLTGPIYQHAIGTFNGCSRWPTHRSLIDTGRGYNLGGAGFSDTTPRPSQPAVSTFHLRAQPGLRLSIQSLPTELNMEQILNLVSGSVHSTSTVSYHLSIACANGNHYVIG